MVPAFLFCRIFEESEKTYIGCDVYWLVIIEGNYYSASVNQICYTPIDSNFEKGFV